MMGYHRYCCLERFLPAGLLTRHWALGRHYFWHFLAALALHHIAVFIGFRRAQLYTKAGSINYIPLYWFEERPFWRNVAAWFESHHASPVFLYILEPLLRWVPWTTWEALTPADGVALMRFRLQGAERRMALAEAGVGQGPRPEHEDLELPLSAFVAKLRRQQAAEEADVEMQHSRPPRGPPELREEPTHAASEHRIISSVL